jgi:ribosomal protein L10
MSKYVKNLLSDHLREQLKGVHDVLVVNMVGLGATTDNRLRKELRNKNIRVLVVKNSLASRAVAGTPLAPAFDGVAGSAAICWGSEDIVSLAKEITKIARDAKFAPFAARGGVMDGERITAAQVEQVSKWPSRMEQLSLLVGQILGPGATLASQLTSAGGAVASQIAQLGEEKEKKDEEKKEEAAPAPA